MRVREDFAGAGGCSQGKRLAGITGAIVGIERDAMAAATAVAAGHPRIIGDVRAARLRAWRDLDGYTAGPPCQTFSMAGDGHGRRQLDALTAAADRVASGALPEDVAPDSDERSVLVLEPMLVIARHRPRWILLEQVPQVLPVWERYAEILAEHWGYHVDTAVLRAEQYGVPQTRKRAFLIAHADHGVRFPPPTHSTYYPNRFDEGVPRWASMADAIGWGMTHRPSMTVMGGGTATGGAEPFGNGARKGIQRERLAGRWITGDVIADEARRRDNARISILEAAALQTFPADYPWQGTAGQRYQQIGNAVPPRLSAAVLSALV